MRSALRREARLVRALAMLLTGRRDLGPGEQPLRYSGPLVPMLTVLLLVDGLVAVLLHALLPEGLQPAALVVGVLGVLWLAGFVASLVCYPHTVSEDALRLRFGAFHEVVLPVAAVRAVSRASGPTRTQRSAERFGDELEMVVAGQANVVVDLVATRADGTGPAVPGPALTKVRFYTDEPQAALSLLGRDRDRSPPRPHQGEG